MSASPQQKKSKQSKKVSFVLDSAAGFKFVPHNDATGTPNDHWKSFGALSQSEYSYFSDRTSFIGSLNRISETSPWFTDEDNAEDEKSDKLPSPKSVAFTFGNKSSRSSSIPSKSPSVEHKHSKSSHSVTFSATVSLYTETEKRQNSLLFFDVWGVPATHQRSVSEESGASQMSQHTHTASLSQDVFTMRHRKQSTFCISGPINEDDEESFSHFSGESEGYEIQMGNSQYDIYSKTKSNLTNDFLFGDNKSATTSFSK